MTPELQVIAIAESQGWKVTGLNPLLGPIGYEPSEIPIGSRVATPIPDYLNDLNAMHEVFAALSLPLHCLWDNLQH